MTDKQILDCEYLIKTNEMRTCKALNVSFYGDTICNKGDCIILKLKQKLKHKEQECERFKWYMQEIRNQELSYLDIEWDQYETHCANTEYSNIINLVEEALEERSPEDCRYGK